MTGGQDAAQRLEYSEAQREMDAGTHEPGNTFFEWCAKLSDEFQGEKVESMFC